MNELQATQVNMRRRIHACHMRRRIHACNDRASSDTSEREEEDTCMPYEEEYTCMSYSHVSLDALALHVCHMRRRIHVMKERQATLVNMMMYC